MTDIQKIPTNVKIAIVIAISSAAFLLGYGLTGEFVAALAALAISAILAGFVLFTPEGNRWFEVITTPDAPKDQEKK